MAYFTTSDGVRIYYESHGTGEPLLLAYGIGGNAGMWQPNIKALSARHRLILWEPRGHARSESPADPTKVTFGHWVLDLRDLMSHLGLVHAGCGHPVSVGYYCPDCKKGVRGTDVAVTRARARRGSPAPRD